jgi:hypothetical protein
MNEKKEEDMTIKGDVEMWLELIYHYRIIIQSFYKSIPLSQQK